ncbi:uncharacterized protein L3040_004201 [Drepanopeziza brunnea f. sp. 'multigermtubi']|uniref:DUF803 domain membrane protein n=1 Tax=Marssonina brunnea f. sp. multigermtubi (strain MB_m1) TaxID=1072389 RepID=K1X5V5_MARBU|nr:DUF803 domain membrane protein [Drepanopeziza brunnea f. sp. 'multigermtubi' MB_m1]EKD20511.1 DUF803 domain membrane protein [Drepanopeziza brunnea f. sp. 'multigermtubi' MB_m1]KAJ5042808.1 hypothetical protein L3040_004201 [Drepanopeziza brunnea f. sp. 'multigermtubi']
MYLPTPTLDPTTASFPAAKLSQISSELLFNAISFIGGGSQLQRWSSLIGIITAVVGNILISFALNIQKYAHLRLHDERARRKEKMKTISKTGGGYGATGVSGQQTVKVDGINGEADSLLSSSFNSQSSGFSHEDQSNYLKSPYWWGGIVLMTVGEAGNFLAYGFAPASIVSPLGVVALISNCVIAPIMLKERFRMRDFWGVLVAVGGAITVVLSAKTEEQKFGPHEIWGAITTTAFKIYMGVTVTLIVVLMFASPKYGNRTILIDLGLVGLFGGYTALSTKGVASMLSSTLWGALTTPVTYALVAVLIATAVMQVRYVNKSLQRFDSTQVIPIQFVMFTLSVIIGSAILYRDFEKATADNFSKFIGGCIMTFFSVWLITSGRQTQDEDDEEEEGSESDGEERISLTGQEEAEDDLSSRDESQRRANVFQNYDGVVEGHGSASRQDSHVSFAEPLERPRSPPMCSNSSYKPSLRIMPFFQGSSQESPLFSSPWKTSPDDLPQPLLQHHPGLQSTISSPVLPSEAHNAPQTSHLLARTISQGNVHTHPNDQQSPAPPQPDLPMIPARHSMSRMLPGPLLSPISGGLSVVARSGGFRRSKSALRRTKSGSQRLTNTSEEDDFQLGTSPVKNDDQYEYASKPQESAGGRVTRARSLSNTLGDMIRGKRQKIDRPELAEDNEAGPSGS